MTMMKEDVDDSYKVPMMAEDEVLVVVCAPPTANQDKQSPADAAVASNHFIGTKRRMYSAH